MVQQPISYGINYPNLGASLMQGMQMGQEMRAKRAAQARQAEMQNDLAAFAEQKNKTAADYQGMMEKYPEMSKQFSTMLDSFNAQQKEAKINQLMSFYAPLKGGNTEAAKKRIDQLIEAYKNSGQPAEAQNMQTIRDNIDLDPQGAITSSEMFLFNAMDPERFKKMTEAQEFLGKERRATEMAPLEQKKTKADIIKAGVDAGLTEKEALRTEAQTRKYDAETQQIFMEMEALKKTGGLDPKKKFDMEQKISDNYYKRSADYIERRTSFDNLLESAKDTTGPGDYALVKSFEKMLEPGSAVLDGEFAKAQAASGKLAEMMNIFAKWTEGTTFKSDKERQYYVTLAKKYMQSAEKADQIVRNDLNRQIKNYGLDPGLLPERRELQETDLAKIKAQRGKPQQQAQPQAAQTPTITRENVDQTSTEDILNSL